MVDILIVIVVVISISLGLKALYCWAMEILESRARRDRLHRAWFNYSESVDPANPLGRIDEMRDLNEAMDTLTVRDYRKLVGTPEWESLRLFIHDHLRKRRIERD